MAPASARRTTSTDSGDQTATPDVSTAWATLLAELIDAHNLTPEKASHVNGGPVIATPRTIRRWLAGEGGVSGDSIRDVCRSLGYPPLRGIARAGWLGADEVSALPPEPKRLHRLAAWVHDILTLTDVVPEAVRTVVESSIEALKKFIEDTHLPPAPAEPHGLARRPGDVRR